MQKFTVLVGVVLAFMQLSLIDLALELSRDLVRLILILVWLRILIAAHRFFLVDYPPREPKPSKRASELPATEGDEEKTGES